jgi:hypothetical protein
MKCLLSLLNYFSSNGCFRFSEFLNSGGHFVRMSIRSCDCSEEILGLHKGWKITGSKQAASWS